MRITFSPVVKTPDTDYELHALTISGDIITANGIEYDLNELVFYDDGTLTKDSGYIRDAAKVDGEWHIGIYLPIGPEASEAQRFPEPVSVTSGPVPLPEPPEPDPEDQSAYDAG